MWDTYFWIWQFFKRHKRCQPLRGKKLKIKSQELVLLTSRTVHYVKAASWNFLILHTQQQNFFHLSWWQYSKLMIELGKGIFLFFGTKQKNKKCISRFSPYGRKTVLFDGRPKLYHVRTFLGYGGKKITSTRKCIYAPQYIYPTTPTSLPMDYCIPSHVRGLVILYLQKKHILPSVRWRWYNKGDH